MSNDKFFNISNG